MDVFPSKPPPPGSPSFSRFAHWLSLPCVRRFLGLVLRSRAKEKVCQEAHSKESQSASQSASQSDWMDWTARQKIKHFWQTSCSHHSMWRTFVFAFHHWRAIHAPPILHKRIQLFRCVPPHDSAKHKLAFSRSTAFCCGKSLFNEIVSHSNYFVKCYY